MTNPEKIKEAIAMLTSEGYKVEEPKAREEYVIEMINKFGEWNLSQEIRYDNGLNPEYGRWSYSQKVKKFIEWINQ